jgi:Flp pilus assembly protein TadD
MADRFNYLPSIGIAVLLSAALVRVPRWRVVLAIALFTSLCAITWQREAVWRNDVSMNRDVLASYPDDPDAWNRLGIAFGERGDRGRELAAYREGLSKNPRHRYLLKNFGAALYQAGRLPEARVALAEALRLSPGIDLQAAKIAYNLAGLLLRQGEAADAVLLLDRVLSEPPAMPESLRVALTSRREQAREAATPR